MRPRFRLGVYLTLWVVSLLAVPLLVPPVRTPSYGPPPWQQLGWTYAPALSYEGSPLPGLGEVKAVETPQLLGGASLELWSFTLSGSATSDWPFLNWTSEYSSGSWTELAWRCPGGGSDIANLTAPLPGGLAFPLTSSLAQSASSAATLTGACGTGAATVSVLGSYRTVVPPGGSTSCTLYVCNAVRQYATTLAISVGVSGRVSPIVQWYLQGLYDPLMSGFRAFSVTPGPPGAWENGSLNLTALNQGGVATIPSPSPETEYLESIATALTVPLLALVAEFWLYRRGERRREEADERAVLAGLTKKEQRRVPSGEVYEHSLDETLEHPPGPPG